MSQDSSPSRSQNWSDPATHLAVGCSDPYEVKQGSAAVLSSFHLVLHHSLHLHDQQMDVMQLAQPCLLSAFWSKFQVPLCGESTLVLLPGKMQLAQQLQLKRPPHHGSLDGLGLTTDQLRGNQKGSRGRKGSRHAACFNPTLRTNRR